MNKTLPLLALVAFGLSGCITPPVGSSQPSHFYRLDLAEPAPLVTDNQVRPDKILIKVQLADALRGPRMAIARSDYELGYLETHRWAEPLNHSTGKLLAEQLKPHFAGAEAAPVVSGFRPDYRVEVIIDKFWGTQRCEVVLDARWSITNVTGEIVKTGGKSYRQKGWDVGDYSELVERMSKMMPLLADSIRESLSSLDESTKN